MAESMGRRTFSTSFRGFDQGEVRAYLEQLAVEFEALQGRIASLESELEVAHRPQEKPPVDVATLTAALGEETGNVLRVAKETADELRTRAEEGAARTLREAHEEAAKIRGAAETVLAERTATAESVAERIRKDGQEEVARLRHAGVTESDAKIAEAVARGREMVGQAQAARERVIADLQRRRTAGLQQLEALRVAREELVEGIRGTRTQVDRALNELERSEEAAKLAAVRAASMPLPAGEPDEAPAAEPPAAGPPPERGSVAPPAAGTQQPVIIEAPRADAAPPEALPEQGPPTEAVATQPVADHADAGGGEEAGMEQDAQPARRPPVPDAPHDAVPTAALPGEAVPGQVDQLFARIRASGAAEAVQPGDDAAGEPAQPVPDTSGHAVLASARSDIDEAYLEQRDGLAEAASATVLRSLRRALADDQNAALERLRTHRGKVSQLDDLLGDEVTQRIAWSKAALPGLLDAAGAGAKLAGGDEPAAGAANVGPVADALADQLVGPLRSRLGGMIDDLLGETGVDRVTGVFRDWRPRLEPLAGDAITAAISVGFTASATVGTMVRWVPEDVGGPCADCDDNALAGAVMLGEPFPTGQPSPPAHPGCRCVLARAAST